MKTMKILFILLGTILISSSCSDDDDIKYTNAGKLSGQWWVKYEVETSPGVWQDVYGAGYKTLLTYNTASNSSTEIIVDDDGSFWEYKAKIAATPSAMSFGVDAEAENLYYDSKVTITDGKVLMDKGHSKTGLKTDSICFMIKFSDDSNNFTYKVSGHKRTGWTFDEY